ncbi:MAG: hypothetical protein V8R11_06200 [Alphaproteobacteria bacterium]|nr:hypothetical protein [Acetobacter sp.]
MPKTFSVAQNKKRPRFCQAKVFCQTTVSLLQKLSAFLPKTVNPSAKLVVSPAKLFAPALKLFASPAKTICFIRKKLFALSVKLC